MSLLETELGTKLFHRHGHGVTLTPDAELLLERCIVLLNEFESIRVDFSPGVQRSAVTGDVGIGIPAPASRLFADLLTDDALLAQSGVSLKIVEGFSTLIHEWLISGSIDLAILYGPQTSGILASNTLVHERLYAILPLSPELLERSSMSMDELASRTLIIPHRPHILRDLLDAQGFVPAGLVEADALSLMIALVRAGRGFTILPFTAVTDAIEAGHVVALPVDDGLTWEVSICSSRLRPPTPAAQAAEQLVRETVLRLVTAKDWKSAALSAEMKEWAASANGRVSSGRSRGE